MADAGRTAAQVEEPEPRHPSSHASAWRRLRLNLGRPIDIAGLAYFRIVFGAVMAWEMWRYLDAGWVERYYTGREIYFKYWPFTFVEPLPDGWLVLVFWLVAATGIFVCIGLFYRLSAIALFIGLLYIFLLDQTRYLNHWYLITLIAFLMIFVPAHRSFSVDARRNPSIRSDVAPAWSLWLLHFQIGIPYFLGGVAKINGDWLRGEPLRSWLESRTDFPIIGSLFTEEPVVLVLNYGSLLFDLSVVFLLLHPRTRVYAFLAAIVFHFANDRLFSIGIFPWLLIAATAIFFDPAWPRRLIADLRRRSDPPTIRLLGIAVGVLVGFLIGAFLPTEFSAWRASIGALGMGVVGYHLALRVQPYAATAQTTASQSIAIAEGGGSASSTAIEHAGGDARPPAVRAAPIFAVALLAAWVTFQVALPLRHFAIPGNVSWTEEGHRFAWHMKLRDKESVASFFVTDRESGRVWEIDNDDFLSRKQTSKMASRPDMIVQYARFLEDEWGEHGYPDVAVTAEVRSPPKCGHRSTGASRSF